MTRLHVGEHTDEDSTSRSRPAPTRSSSSALYHHIKTAFSYHPIPGNLDYSKSISQLRTKESLTSVERATLDALIATLRGCNAHYGGSAIGKGFRLAARYHLHKRAPHSLPLIGGIGEKSQQKQRPVALPQWDDSALEPGVQRTIEDPFYIVDLGIVTTQLARWRAAFPRVVPYYAIKCNPDPAIVRTLMSLGCNFDCASRGEIGLVQEIAMNLPDDVPKPEIIYANPCKGRGHVIDAVCRGVRMMTFDNVAEVHKCASVSKKIQLIMRIITDDSGSQCRLSSKFGAPPQHWPILLAEAKRCGLDVVGVSFRCNPRPPTAHRDGGHSIHSGGDEADVEDVDDEVDAKEGKESDDERSNDGKERQCMYFNEIAEAIAPMLDELFPPSSGVKIIAEPGRYLVAACSTLVASVTSVRSNRTSDKVPVQAISDRAAADNVFSITRAEEDEIVQGQGRALEQEENPIIETLVEELADYSQRFARATLSQQEVDVYLDNINVNETFEDVLADGPDMVAGKACTEDGVKLQHTVEGMQAGIVVGCADMFDDDASAISGMRSSAGNTKFSDIGLDIPCVLAAAGEAAVSGIVRQAIADAAQPVQDDFAYYINDGVYGAFNNLLFDHATVRPRKLRNAISAKHQLVEVVQGEGDDALRTIKVVEEEASPHDDTLYPSTVFGPTCDSMDVLSRGVLLPKLEVGDWMYFQNMGAYTSAAASTFNGFPTTEKFYGRVGLDAEATTIDEEKKED
ncbi:hypothetical protein ACHAW5_002897 [Stephanodiscus triporus]|uniref:ornithine decarboxylase n=1 Tax=Stephanodiscus triporus TaxID=2934178 RepID=A0ABD3PVT2_9STRA